MAFSTAQLAIASIGGLHVLFAAGELIPGGSPLILKAVLKKWPKPLDLSANDKNLVAMIVHNAGIYNGIVAAALFATLWLGPAAYPVQLVLLAGGIVAGLFGALTLTKATILQAILGSVALALLVSSQP